MNKNNKIKFNSINEAKVAADAAKRFKMLCEYTFNITEDDGEEEVQNNEEQFAGGEQMPPEQDDNVTPEQNGEQPSMGNEQMPPEQNGGAPGFNPEPQGMDGEQMSSEQGEEMTPGDDMMMDGDTMQPDDEVIDVDELTQSQEETEAKVEDVEVSMEKGFDKLLNVVDKLQQMIDANTTNMEQIKQEFEKRNPTPLEKLNMRAANDSYPFNISPNDYWKEKEATSNYRIGGEDEPDAKQYTITQADIDNDTDFQRIAKELEAQEFNQNLMNVFGLR